VNAVDSDPDIEDWLVGGSTSAKARSARRQLLTGSSMPGPGHLAGAIPPTPGQSRVTYRTEVGEP
jgi:hypothetical protein